MATSELFFGELDTADLSEVVTQTKAGTLTVHNVLAAADLSCSLNLDKICQCFGNCDYNPDEFHTLKIEVRSNVSHAITLVSLFESGKMTATGSNSIEETHKAMKKVARKLKAPPLSLDVQFQRFEVANIFSVFNCGFSILLNKLFRVYRGTDYEPERNAAAIIRIPIEEKADQTSETHLPLAWESEYSRYDTCDSLARKPTKMKTELVTLKVFSTGNITLLGGRRISSLLHCIDTIRPYLLSCKAPRSIESKT